MMMKYFWGQGWEVRKNRVSPYSRPLWPRTPRLGLTYLLAPGHPQTVHSWKGRECQVRGPKLYNPGSKPS